MQIKQKYRLSKVVQILEKVLYERIKIYSYLRKINFIQLQIIVMTIQYFMNTF